MGRIYSHTSVKAGASTKAAAIGGSSFARSSGQGLRAHDLIDFIGPRAAIF